MARSTSAWIGWPSTPSTVGERVVASMAEDLNRAIYRLPPKEKKDLIEGLVEGDIEIGDGLDGGEKWQIVRMSLAFKPEAFKGLLGG